MRGGGGTLVKGIVRHLRVKMPTYANRVARELHNETLGGKLA